jgi:hypothetical protein
MINVLLCGEGVTDEGRAVYFDSKYIQQDGVFQTFMRKIANNIELQFFAKTRHDLKAVKTFPKRFEGTNKIKARKLAQLAKMNNCSHSGI